MVAISFRPLRGRTGNDDEIGEKVAVTLEDVVKTSFGQVEDLGMTLRNEPLDI